MEKKISLIIVTYNSLSQIKGCLNSIFQYNDIGDALEIIVVDNDSDDYEELSNWLSLSYGNKVLLIRNSENKGYGAGNNMGIENSSAPIILIMNPDVRLFKPIMSEALLDFSLNNKMAILGMKQFETLNQIGQSFLPIIPSVFNLFRLKYYKLRQKYSSTHFCIHGSCFFIRKDVMKIIGGFDENIFLYNEERDLHIRILQNGYDVDWNRNLGYIHPMHSRTVNKKLLEEEFASFKYVNEKYGLNWKSNIFKVYRLNRLLYYKARLFQKKEICRYFEINMKIIEPYL